jgi:endosialidase-like protein
MKITNNIRSLASLLALALCLSATVLAQSANKEDSVAAVTADRSEVRWQPQVEYARLILTVSMPGGEVFRKEFEPGVAPSFALTEKDGNTRPDGDYSYELRVIPNLTPEVRRALAASRKKGDSAEVIQELQSSGQLPSRVMVQSGFFMIENGVASTGSPEGGSEPQNPGGGKIRAEADGGVTKNDVVTPDDAIIQGSACVGLDCVNGEVFGFDTIRMKENNTRLQFDDTSGAGFATNNWQIRANNSAGGGGSFLAFVDQGATGNSETGTIVFEVDAGAPANSLRVSSAGRVGVRTATPVLDLHVASGDTPAQRLEQTAASGFSAQTWDIAGNEANFFVRDVTGGSRLPFRIRPGAPTSSLDIAASGNVGIGTQAPGRKVEIAGTNNVGVKITDTSISNAAFLVYLRNTNASLAGRQFSIFDENASVDRLVINSSGQIGFGGALTPTNPLEHGSGARLTAGGVWTDASSRALKTNIRSLTAKEAVKTVLELNPVTFEYKAQRGESYTGFIAEDVPELVATSDRTTLSSMDIVAVLTRVVQEQQNTIAELKAKMTRLEKRVANTARLQSRNSRKGTVR